MSSKNGDVYHQLYLAYKSNHPFKSAALCQKESNVLWQEAKSKFRKSNSEFHAEIRKLIENFQIESTRKKTGFLNFFLKVRF